MASDEPTTPEQLLLKCRLNPRWAAVEIIRLRALFRVNMLFHANGATHESIDKLLEEVTSG